MVKAATQNLTLAEFLKLPETKPASEYINGKIIQKPMPQGKHSILQGELVSAINSLVKPPRIAHAFPELRCTFGERSIVPDVTVFAWERIPLDENGDVSNVFPIHPDWTIEILSPDQNLTKVTRNILHCLNWGSSLGWMLDLNERLVLVYPPKQQPEIFAQEQDILPVPDLVKNFQLTVGQLFNWLKL